MNYHVVYSLFYPQATEAWVDNFYSAHTCVLFLDGECDDDDGGGRAAVEYLVVCGGSKEVILIDDIVWMRSNWAVFLDILHALFNQFHHFIWLSQYQR